MIHTHRAGRTTRLLLAITGVVVALVCQRSFAIQILDQSHIVTQSVGGLISVKDFTPAQTFTVGAQGTLSQIDLQIGRDAGALDDLSLEIWPTSGGLPTGAAPLYTTTIPASSVPVAGPSASLPFTSVNLSGGNLQVTPGQTYAAALRAVPDFGDPHAFWNWGYPGYSGGNPVATGFGGPWQVQDNTYDFGFKTWVTPPPAAPGPPGPTYSLFETATALPKGSTFTTVTVDANHYQGVNFEVVRPTRLSSLGGYLYGGTGQIFGAVVKLNDINGAPNPTSFTGADVLATTLLNTPGGTNLADVTTPLDLTLQPGFYGFWLGSGKFGATGQTSMFAQNASAGSWYTWSMSQPSGTRNFGNNTLRFIVNASSDSGTVQLRPTVDGEADLTSGSYVVKDTTNLINVSRSADHRSLMEFSLANVPAHAVVTAATLQFDVREYQSNGTSHPHMLVYGYAGNGQLSAADAAASTTLIGTSPDISSSTDVVTVNLNPAYIQSLLGTSNYLGLLGLGDLNNLSFSFLPKENGGVGETAFLSLSVSVPGDYNGDLKVDATDYNSWRSSYGSTTNLSADGNKNGKIDAGDYVSWRNNVSSSGAGSGALAPAAPEPPGLLLVVIAAAEFLASCTRRRLLRRSNKSAGCYRRPNL